MNEFNRLIQDQIMSVNAQKLNIIYTNKKLCKKIKQLQKWFPLRT